MAPRKPARSSSRRLSPQSPAKSAPQPGSPQTRRTARGTRDTEQGASGLPPVTESNEYQEVGAGLDEDEIQESVPSQAPSDVSSDSQGELDALSYDLILDSLPDLETEAVKLLHNFQGTDNSNLEDHVLSLRNPSAPSTRRFSIQLKKLLATREAFGGRLWALPSIIIRKLRDGQAWCDIHDGMWRPDAILYLANLAQLVAALCLATAGDATLLDTFSFFPQPFSSTDAADRFTTGYVQTLLQVGDNLRTQLFVHEARKRVGDPNFDPDTLLTQVFFDTDYSARIAPLTEQLGQQYNSEHQNRLKHIRSAFSKNSKNPIQFEKLEKAFSWNSFVFHTVQWAVQRQQEVEALISAQDGGGEGIVEAIRAGHFNIAPKLVAPASGPALTKRGQHMATRGGRGGRGGRKAPDLSKNIGALKKGKVELAERRTAPTPLNPNLFENQENAAAADALRPLLEATQQMNSGYGPVNDDETGVPPSAQGPLSPTTAARQVQYIMGTMNEQERQANKENMGSRGPTRSYMDPQAGADRVAWTPDSQEDFPGPSGTKRRQPTADSDESDDFEEDDRQPKRPRPNKGKARAIPEPSPILDQQYPYPGTQPSYASTQPTRSPLREQTRPPPSTAPVNYAPPASQLPPGTAYSEINQLAKQNVTATRERDNRHIVQQRKPYTEEEVQRLMDLIAINQGPKYAKILKDDKEHPSGRRLEGRSQVQLKDKARNIKMDYLKARQRLPNGFANVSIGKRMVEILRGMGIDYVEGDWMGAGSQAEGVEED